MSAFSPQGVGISPTLRDRELDSDKPADTVVFLSTEPGKEKSHVAELIEAAEKAAAANIAKVKVLGNYRVLHETKPYVGGDVLELPMATASKWIKAGWVELVSPPKKASK
jgi:hypothetical protein